MSDLNKLVEELGKLSVIEAAELVKKLEEAWGVSAAAPVAVAAAGGAAALAGVVAAHTIVPVIGIPIETSSLKGIDSLLSTVQMPGGVPVASMAIGKAGAKNAALFVLEILGLVDKKIQAKLCAYKNKMRVKIKNTKIKL